MKKTRFFYIDFQYYLKKGVPGVLGVPGLLGLGGLADQSLVLVEGYVGGHGVVSLLVGDDFDLLGGHDGHAGEGGSEINADSGAGFFRGGSIHVGDK